MWTFLVPSFSGLEDQLLALVVAEERPDLEEAKNQLIISNAKMKQELKAIEDKILHRLSSSEGSPVDDIDLIHTLEQSKIKSQEIKVCPIFFSWLLIAVSIFNVLLFGSEIYRLLDTFKSREPHRSNYLIA